MIIATNPTERAQLFTQIETNGQRTDGLFKEYAGTISEPRDRELFEEAKQARAPFLASLERVKAAVREGKVSEAGSMLDHEMPPVFDKYMQSLEALVEFNKADATTSAQDIATTVAQSKMVVMIAFGVSLVFSLFISFSIVRAIKKPLVHVAETLAKIRTGDLTQRVVNMRQDEMGESGNGLNATANDLSSLIGKVQESGLQINTAITQMAGTMKEQ